MPRFPSPPSVDALPGMEEAMLRLWAQRDVFRRSVARPAERGDFVFFEGPPTANNVPHIGHALTRAVKDVVPRWKSMQGHRVRRKAGWDTHGLPVEISVEKALGFTDKNAVEAYGVEAFNQKCFESVRTYEREWVKASERLGFWLDYDDAYFTFTNRYVENVWQILKRLYDADMLYEGHKVLPYCPLCGTTHSSHEVAQAYEDVADPSVTAALPLLPGQSRNGVDLADVSVLVWTTTPWTLPSNMAACVHPDFAYKLVASSAFPGKRYLIGGDMQAPIWERVGKDQRDLREQAALATFRGADLEGLRYRTLFGFTGRKHRAAFLDGADQAAPPGSAERAHRGGAWSVVCDPYVQDDSGSGIVHVAPAFGEDDHRVGKAYSLPMYCAMGLDGKFVDHAEAGGFDLRGLWFKDADPKVVEDLKLRGLLVYSTKYEHPYPHCWRHGTPLYYFATSSWFVRTTAMKDRLVANNKKIRWVPAHIGDGRFGKWLDSVVDWALSRKRYWGTPLPIWRCAACASTECFGTYEALFARAGRDLPDDPYDRDQWNPHRPYVDDLTLGCDCGGEKRRVVEVIDCWFDAGSMPFAQHARPFDAQWADQPGGRGFGAAFPADFISEAVDQTRGWFYTLHVIATFLRDEPAFRSCIVLGHVLDEQGRKMSKSLGNVVAPGPIIDQFGADAFRWFFYRSNPTVPSRFGPNMVRESLKGFLLPLLNAWSFFTIYGNLDGFTPAEAPSFHRRAPLDRFILSRFEQTVAAVTAALEALELQDAASSIEGFVDDLTNWYIRRSRRRFWGGVDGNEADKAAAHHTLWEVLGGLSRLLAPFVPFLAERMHQDLVVPYVSGAADSVHLERWPTPDPARIDGTVLARQAAARQIVSLGLAARETAGQGVRQPLRSATVVTVAPAVLDALSDAATRGIVEDELNVKRIEVAADRSAWVSYEVKPNFRVLGKRFGARMKAVAAAVAARPAEEMVREVETRGAVEVIEAGEALTLSRDELDVRIQQKAGTISVFDERILLALDAELDPALLREGMAREIVSRLAGLRRDADLAYDARIEVRYRGDAAIREAIEAHRDFIVGEVLAVDLRPDDDVDLGVAAVHGRELFLSIAEVAP